MIWATALVARNVLGYKMSLIQMSYCQTKRKEKMQKYEILPKVPNNLAKVNKTKLEGGGGRLASCQHIWCLTLICVEIFPVFEKVAGAISSSNAIARPSIESFLINRYLKNKCRIIATVL